MFLFFRLSVLGFASFYCDIRFREFQCPFHFAFALLSMCYLSCFFLGFFVFSFVAVLVCLLFVLTASASFWRGYQVDGLPRRRTLIKEFPSRLAATKECPPGLRGRFRVRQRLRKTLPKP